MFKLALIVILSLLMLGLGLELLLRWTLGFGNPPLYVADENTGYRFAPNQTVRRFGNRVVINQYSMRSNPITKTPAPDTLRILLLGDSIANGGWWTDQQDILSERIEQALVADLPGPYKTVEVLNASANSWGPRNELGYLKAFGHFDAAVIVLLINTDDLFATAPTSVQVGRDRSYPAHKPPLALAEVYTRLFIKPEAIPELQAVQQEGGDRVGNNLQAIHQIQTLTQAEQSHLLLAMTPLLREVRPPGSRDYELEARQRVNDFTTDKAIPYLDFLEDFKAQTDVDALYRDHIHLSQAGNERVTQEIAQKVQYLLNSARQL
ncbi:MAG: SGNH/GDSL hydrolase family protein [Cyanobacteria bacterium P01_A01_bin.123]